MEKPSVLIVDADPAAARLLEVGLRKAGFAVTTSIDDQALAAYTNTKPALIVLGAKLAAPFDLAARLRASATSDVPLLLLSDRAGLDVRTRALEAGISDCLLKPYTVKEIVARARMAVRRRVDQGGTQRLGGSLADMEIVDIIHSLSSQKATCAIHCQSHGRKADLWLHEGQLTDAVMGSLAGEEAFHKLLTWSEGRYDASFEPYDHAPRIVAATETVIAEGLRRLAVWGRALEKLPPLSARLAVDGEALARRLEPLDTIAETVLRLFDGKRTLDQVIDEALGGELSTIEATARLFQEGVLHERSAAAVSMPTPAPLGIVSTGAPAVPSDFLPLEVPPAPLASSVPTLIRFPAKRGLRKERLVRERRAGAEPVSSPLEPTTPAPVIGAAPFPTPHYKRYRLYSAAALVAIVAATPVAIRWRQTPVHEETTHPLAAPTPSPAPATARKSHPAPPRAFASTISPEEEAYAKELATGEASLKHSDVPRAVAAYRRAVELKPESAAAQMALGDALLETDDAKAALEALEKAARLNPKSGRTLVLLGAAHQAVGNNAAAMHDYDRYLSLEPNGPSARDVRAILDGLRAAK